jgi:uncharacterized protein (DUF488 family)
MHRVLTIGHSNRSIEEFIALLEAHGVTRLVDVRTVPRSRHNPQFNADALPRSLAAHGITHTSMRTLGGLRKPLPDSPNQAWRNESFRGYADYMQSPEFASALEELMGLAIQDHIAIMCAEAVPWRCHRNLIADALVARGVEVAHIMSAAPANTHALTPFAKLEGTRVTYPERSLFDPQQ